MVIGDRQLYIHQATQGLANWGTADLKLGRQLGFHQTLAGL
jgi:hypothetical protein